MKVRDIDRLSEDEVREYLAELMEALDNLDEDDYFGPRTQGGWRKFLMGEY